MTVQGGSGFEHGATVTTNGGGLADIITGSPTIVSSNAHTGSRALQLNTSAAIIRYGRTLSSAQNVFVFSFYFKLATLPAANCDLFYITLTDGGVISLRFYQNDSNKVGFRSTSNDTAKSASGISADTYYRVDLRCVANTDPKTVEWKLNKVDQTSYSSSGTGTTVANWRFGTNSADTYNCYYDDYDFSFASGDYPIGGGNETGHEALVGTADGTHSAGTNVMEDNAGTDIGATTAYDKVNSIPPSATTYVRQAAAGTGNYAEVQFANISATHNGIVCACLILAYTSETTSSNNGGCIVSKDDFASQTVVHGVAGALVDYSDGSTSNLYYKSVMIAGVTDDTTVNAIEARMGYAGDANPDPYWIDLIVEAGYTFATGTPVGQTTETDTSQPIAKVKSKASGQVSETDLAQVLTRVKQLATLQVTESDLAQAIARVKIVAVAQVTETDLAQPIVRSGATVPVGQVSETDAAQTITAQKARAVSQIVETDLSQAVGRQKNAAVAQIAESDTAQALTGQKAKAVGQISETDAAQVLAGQKIKALAQVMETDLAQPISAGGSTVVPVAQVIETDAAQAISRQKVRTLGQVEELDNAQAITFVSVVAMQQVTETDLAQALFSRKVKVVGQIAEIDSLQTVTPVKQLGMLQVMETDLAQALFGQKTKAISLAVETDLAQVVSVIGGAATDNPIGRVVKTWIKDRKRRIKKGY